MADFELAVDLREGTGKGVARKLRAAGRIPGVCYGHGTETQAISIDPVALDRLLRSSAAGMNTLIDLKGGLSGKLVLVKELQRDPVSGRFLHADLYSVQMDEEIEVSVPLHIVGNAKGVVLEGGILDHQLREIEVSCLPRAIPEELRLDVSELALGDSLHVRDIALPEGVTCITDANLSVVSVVAPAKAEEEAVAEEAEATEEGVAAPEGEAAPKAEGSEEKSGD